MTNLEKALLSAAKAFIDSYSDSSGSAHGTLATPQRKTPQSAPTATSNDIPVCSVHGKAHKPSKSGKGYYCVDCYIERKNANRG